MKRLAKKIICLSFAVILIGMVQIAVCTSVSAASSVTRTSGRKTYKTLYAVPEGGWSTIVYETELIEKYTYSSSKKQNIFNRHEKICLWKTAYATTKPNLTIGNIVHMDSNDKTIKTFTSYTKQPSVYGGEWDGCHDYYCTYGVGYSLNSKNYAMLPFYTSCDGGMFAGGTEGVWYHKITVNLR